MEKRLGVLDGNTDWLQNFVVTDDLNTRLVACILKIDWRQSNVYVTKKQVQDAFDAWVLFGIAWSFRDRRTMKKADRDRENFLCRNYLILKEEYDSTHKLPFETVFDSIKKGG